MHRIFNVYGSINFVIEEVNASKFKLGPDHNANCDHPDQAFYKT